MRALFFLNHKSLFALALLSLGSFFLYQNYKIEKLEKDNIEKDVTIEVIKETAKVENFETKWQTIAKEHNKTEEGDEENASIILDDEYIDITFFGGM
jgi:hypothetical protein